MTQLIPTFWHPGPDLSLVAISMLMRSTKSSLDFMAWFLSWPASLIFGTIYAGVCLYVSAIQSATWNSSTVLLSCHFLVCFCFHVQNNSVWHVCKVQGETEHIKCVPLALWTISKWMKVKGVKIRELLKMPTDSKKVKNDAREETREKKTFQPSYPQHQHHVWTN